MQDIFDAIASIVWDINLILQLVATITGILCVYLQTREKILAWPFGIVSVSISAYIFAQSGLYSDVILHMVYVVLNIYGWWNWHTSRRSNTSLAPILLLAKKAWVIWAITIVIGTGVLGVLMGHYTDASVPYFDAFTTVGSLVAQYLLAKKILQNWILWILVDVVAINVYIYKEIYIIAFLFLVYLMLSTKGYFDWKKQHKRQQSQFNNESHQSITLSP
jgi:nicotinamide mononucleotide transporter